MSWRRGELSVLPYSNDFFFSKKGRHACRILCLRVRKDFFEAGLIINVPKCLSDPVMCLRQLGFEVGMKEGRFRVPEDRREALHTLMDSILSARGGRVQARKLASLAGTDISMKLAWVLVTQLYSRYIYVLIHSAFSLD